MKNITLTIGIPAYNEELNISQLLQTIQKQQIPLGIMLKEVIVVSDGSTDATCSVIKNIKDDRIKLIRFERRQGIAIVQNEIVKKASGDILILLDADILPLGKLFLKNIIKPLINNSPVGLVGANTVSLPARTIVERIIEKSHKFKTSLYRQIHKGNTIYLCHGRARAFSKNFYKKITWPKECPEDAYSYLYCIKLGFQFVYSDSTKVLFRSPGTVSDHKKQSIRFSLGTKYLENYFSKKVVMESFKIPTLLMMRELLKFAFNSPFEFLGYTLITVYIYFQNENKIDLNKWDVSFSSKMLTDIYL